MKKKVSKSKIQNETKRTSVRIRRTTKSDALEKLKETNSKDFGKPLKLDDLFAFYVARVSKNDILAFQERQGRARVVRPSVEPVAVLWGERERIRSCQ